MTPFRFLRRSLRYYWRTHLGVLAGVAVASAILTGALAVGDSVRFSLRQLALARLGRVTHALTTGDRYFREALADQTGTVPALLTRGTVAAPDRETRANEVQVVGVDARFWQLGATTNFDGLVLNERLATRLGASAGDAIIVRFELPSWVPRDVPLSGRSGSTVAIRAPVSAVAGDRDFGRFSLQANQLPPCTVFVPLALLQQELRRPGAANTLLADQPVPDLGRYWTLADAELVVTNGQLSTPRVFLDPPVAAAALGLSSNAVGVLTYFVNEIRCGDKATPYSFVTAVGNEPGLAINTWLAADLGAKVGDEVTLRYYVIGERRELREETARLPVRRIFPVTKDDAWMPAFPGLADVENCRDWEPGIPIALDRIRPQDEAYWQQYRGTPKAFVSLATGQQLWGNRFGNLTAIQFPASVDVAARLKVDPPAFVPVREQAWRASEQAQDFGQLFVGFSLFLIVAAVLLTGMLFVLNLEQRRAESGLLRAIGLAPAQVRRLVLLEGGALALVGTLVGVVAGVGYTKLTLLGLATVWRGAIGATALSWHATPATLGLGAGLSLLAALGAMWIGQRQQARQTPLALLTGSGEVAGPPNRQARSVRGGRVIPFSERYQRWGRWVAVAGGAGAAVLLPLGSAGAFFGAGACLLVAGIGLSNWLLRLLANGPDFGCRNAARRPGRSLTTIAVLGSGVFLLVAVNAFYQKPGHDAPGTGGFAWYAQTALPVYEGLPAGIALRLRDGDDASCLNLNRAQQPRLLGADPAALARRQAFGGRWERLSQATADGAVPAIGDEATVRWALGKRLGDTLPYSDERGQTFQLRIVDVLPNSILQGSLIIAESSFNGRFPSAAGYRVFLLDAVPAEWARSLADRGFEAVPAWRRLAEFAAVENTYLAIFQALGGLGLVLGSVGLAIVVWRNVLERRGELALLQAVGFERRALRRLVVFEHWLLVALGIGTGLVAALVAVGPTAGLRLPVGPLVLLAVGGLAWSWLAATAALRGPLLPALRNE